MSKALKGSRFKHNQTGLYLPTVKMLHSCFSVLLDVMEVFLVSDPWWRSLTSHTVPTLISIKSSGREHTVVYLIQSGDDDYLMNETRRKLPPGHNALLFSISGTGYSRTNTADIPRPLFTHSRTTGGKSKCCSTRQIRTAVLSVHSRACQPPDQDDRPE